MNNNAWVKLILKEHSKRQCHLIVDYVGDHSGRFAQLVAVFLAGPYRVTQRAALPISVVVERNPDMIKPHLKDVIQLLKLHDLHPAVKRNIVRLLQFIEIPKSLQGTAADACFRLLQDSSEPIAVRVFSMTVLSHLAKLFPELRNELITIIESQIPYASAGFQSRGKKILNELKK